MADLRADELDGFSEEEPLSPVLPISQDNLRVRAAASDRDKSPARTGRCRPVNRALIFDPSSSESESEAAEATIQKNQNLQIESGNQSVLLELKQMLAKVCKKVDQNEHVLKELQDNIVM